jgi:hypothetical protein
MARLLYSLVIYLATPLILLRLLVALPPPARVPAKSRRALGHFTACR